MLLYLKVKPDQRADKVEQTSEGWLIRLKAPATDGKANEHLVRYLSDILEISRSSIVLKKGFTSRFKCLEIDAPESAILTLLEAASEK